MLIHVKYIKIRLGLQYAVVILVVGAELNVHYGVGGH